MSRSVRVVILTVVEASHIVPNCQRLEATMAKRVGELAMRVAMAFWSWTCEGEIVQVRESLMKPWWARCPHKSGGRVSKIAYRDSRWQ